MSELNTEYDVIVIGGGPAGENVADVAARDGLSVALIESKLLGGECSYWACMPSKGLLRPGEILNEVSRVPGASSAVTGTLDVEAAFERRNSLSSHWDDKGQQEWVESVGVDLIRGHGRLAGEKAVEVASESGATTSYTARRAVVIATGTSAATPPIPGLDDIVSWDNRDITVQSTVPERLLIIGGGVVGVEMAQAWKQLGSREVTIVELADHLLIREEPFAGAEVRKSLERLGVEVLTSAETKLVTRRGDDGEVTAQVSKGGEELQILADEILIAAGRRPLTADIGLESIGLEPGESIEVDDHLRATSVPGGWLYAVGDVNGRSLLTHTGKYQARIAGAHINGVDTAARDKMAIPRVIFTSPEVAAVGLTEHQATEQGTNIRTVQYDIGKTAAAGIVGKGYGGTCKFVIDSDQDVIIGATFVGPRVGEMLHSATIAIVGEVPLNTLWHAIPSFPTLSEVWLRLLETYRDEFDVQFV